jgi:hypothetical protein
LGCKTKEMDAHYVRNQAPIDEHARLELGWLGMFTESPGIVMGLWQGAPAMD